VNTEQIEFKPKDTDVLIACPYCKVCSIVLSAEEYALVKSGQQLVEVCQVCGKEVYLNGSNQ
jgi:predicted  nucleic acid-binding Zn-ribbon protein